MVDYLRRNHVFVLQILLWHLDVYPRFLCNGIYVFILSIGFVDLTAVWLEHFLHGHLNSQAIILQVQSYIKIPRV